MVFQAVWQSILIIIFLLKTLALTGSGGGIYASGTSSGLYSINNVFWGNYAGGNGGGILWNDSAYGELDHGVFCGNYTEYGGDAAASNVGYQIIKNIIAWNNLGPDGSDVTYGGPAIIVDNSLVQHSKNLSGTNNVVGDTDPPPEPLPDPMFVNPSSPMGDDGIWFTQDDGYLIFTGSSAIDLGDPAILPDMADVDGDGDTSEPFPLDILGNPRTSGTGPDAGVNEILQ